MKEKKIVSLTMYDFIKGLAMIFVLIHHSMTLDMQDNIFSKVMMSVCMPLFFLTSGFWLKKKKMDKAIKDTFKFAIKPYLIVEGLILGIGFLHRLLLGDIAEWVSEFLMPFIFGISGTRIGPAWFVLALALAWIIFHFITNYLNDKMQWIVVSVLACIGGFLCTDIILVPFQIPQAFIGQFFVYIGYQLKKKGFFEKKIAWYWYASMLCLWIICICFGKMDLALYDVGLGIVDILGSVCGTIIVLKLVLPCNHLEFPLKEQIMTVGHYSMWVLCVHSLECAVVPWKVLFKFVEQTSVVGAFSQLILRSIFIIAGCVFLKNWSNIKHRVFGRKGKTNEK